MEPTIVEVIDVGGPTSRISDLGSGRIGILNFGLSRSRATRQLKIQFGEAAQERFFGIRNFATQFQ
jgi:hypothetical protein